MGASLRDITEHDLEGSDGIFEVAIAHIEEVEAPIRNQHDGRGFHTKNRITCRHHNSEQNSSLYWDCPQMIADLQDYLKQNYIDKVDEMIHLKPGVVTTNISERVGMVALTFRDKKTYPGPEHYALCTNLAPLHLNDIGF